MVVDHVFESQNAGLLESVLMTFDIYNDSAQQALVVLKQCSLYDEIEAEVDHCFDIFVSKLCEMIFTHYKSWAASELLDPSFLFSLDNGEKYSLQPMRLNALFKMTRFKLLGRTIDLRSLIAERMNKIFRENLEFLFDRFESQDLCAIVVLRTKLIKVLRLMSSISKPQKDRRGLETKGLCFDVGLLFSSIFNYGFNGYLREIKIRTK